MEQQMPSVEEMLQWLDSNTALSEEDKESIRQSILNPLNPMRHEDDEPEPYVDPGINVHAEWILVQVAVFILILIAVFFGYKLYRSLMDKEKKKEDKKKLKIQKKKQK